MFLNWRGLWFYEDRDEKVVCCQNEGHIAGVSVVMRYFPEQEINVVILSNIEGGVWDPILKIHEWVVDGRIQ